jgi:hypothetical protein
LAIEDVEEFEQRLQLNAFGDIESLGNAKIQIDERRSGKGVSTWSMIYGVEGAIPVRILEINRPATEMKPTLSTEDSTDLKLPR